ncbi:ADP-heptose:LPS heptosyltransferase [Arthrobacter sp. 49Tsu3.1M3]|uniref:glycosyltransferase family 9 protein n=1 Tax=Arthrobacter sp. 49Tsu3.1M3 TaxID=1279029 RepID=UPI0009CF713B|nr:glycosyltransferase family 9 protein [Arthrobacter sp. 49Tsu3.1M3]SKC10048.1 ADP-heptose:LPS heptosyltransferase [Arthrobacter sp. 49Tsu3.1M3]
MRQSDGRPVVLVLRALKLGDLLVAVPALHALRRAFPAYRLLYAAQAWLTDAVSLVGGFELFPTHGLDVPLALTPGQVNVAVNMHGRGPESDSLLEALRPQRIIGHASEHRPGPPWEDDVHERQRWVRLLQWHGMDADPGDFFLNLPAVGSARPSATVVHPGAAYGSRLWPESRFAQVAAALSKTGHDVVFTGSAAERPRAARIAELAGLGQERVLAGQQSLAGFAAIIAESRLVVSADTGAAHLATAYGRPSVVLFGPASPDHWGPPPGPHIVLTRAELRRGDTFASEPDPALLGVEVAEVLEAVRRLGLL